MPAPWGWSPIPAAWPRWTLANAGSRVYWQAASGSWSADYEVRRELLRARKAEGLARLDALEEALEYLPLTSAAMRRAAELWAEARQQGPTHRR